MSKHFFSLTADLEASVPYLRLVFRDEKNVIEAGDPSLGHILGPLDEWPIYSEEQAVKHDRLYYDITSERILIGLSFLDTSGRR